CLLAQLLGVAPPLVGEPEQQSAACGIVRRFGGASAFLRMLLVEAHECHGCSSIPVRATPASQVTLSDSSRHCCTAVPFRRVNFRPYWSSCRGFRRIQACPIDLPADRVAG